MMPRSVLSIFLCLTLSSCGIFSDPAENTDYIAGGLIGTAAGAGIGAAIGSAISNGDVANSAYLGAGVGLAVGVVGTYAYKKIKVRNTIVDNDEAIENNRQGILLAQEELDRLREEVLVDTYNIQIESEGSAKVYDGATLGNYYR